MSSKETDQSFTLPSKTDVKANINAIRLDTDGDVDDIVALYDRLREKIGAKGGKELNTVAATLAAAVWAKRK